MIYSSHTAVLDANVLYPAPLRDLLLHLADVELYEPKWTKEIQEEWIRSLLLKRIDLKRANLEKTREAMDSAFPGANVVDYEEIISGIFLPDNNDRHVLTAAIKVNADVIVTFNIKDFPTAYLKPFGIEVYHPDEFNTGLIKFDKQSSIIAFRNQVKNLRFPSKSEEEVLISLAKCGLVNCLEELKK
ncbi:MAG: PIN domain-containing protein [Ginsengibacter sp.]